jgi:hypothetical protein
MESAQNTSSSWSAGPGEILVFGTQLLKEDTDTNRRIALILIDNAVEQSMITFISLPKRVTGLQISRKPRSDICENFSTLLDGIEELAGDKLEGVDLAEIEWFHRIRNQLYHDGNGLTVERKKVEVYALIAKTLYRALFGSEPKGIKQTRNEDLGKFFALWTEIERLVSQVHSVPGSQMNALAAFDFETAAEFLLKKSIDHTYEDIPNLLALRNLRHNLGHGMVSVTDERLRQAVEQADELKKKIRGVFN